MIIKKIIDKLEELSPPHYAYEWDNVGLLVGDENSEVNKVMIVVDLHKDLLDTAIKENVDLIISHHPICLKGIKKITNNDFIGNKLIELIKNNISVYTMHTNFDVCGSMGEEAANKLWLKEQDVLIPTNEDGHGLGIIGTLSSMTIKSLVYLLKDSFGIDLVKVYGNTNQIVNKIAILPGSGKDGIEYAINKKAEVLITGDISHHHGLDAVEQGLNIIDAGHYGIEKIFIDAIYKYMSKNFDDIEIIKEEKHEKFEWL